MKKNIYINYYCGILAGTRNSDP